MRANRGQSPPLAQPRRRRRRRLFAQRFCKQLQSQPTVAFLDGQASALNRAAHSNVVAARPVVGLGNTQRHGAGGDRRASVHGSKTSKPREFCTVCFDSKRLQYVQSTNAARASHRSWVLYVGHSQVFFAFCATALKRTQSVATCNMCWVCYGTLSGAVLALWRGCFEMRTQPFTTQHVLGMLCCMLKPRHDTHTHSKKSPKYPTPHYDGHGWLIADFNISMSCATKRSARWFYTHCRLSSVSTGSPTWQHTCFVETTFEQPLSSL